MNLEGGGRNGAGTSRNSGKCRKSREKGHVKTPCSYIEVVFLYTSLTKLYTPIRVNCTKHKSLYETKTNMMKHFINDKKIQIKIQIHTRHCRGRGRGGAERGGRLLVEKLKIINIDGKW